MATLRSFPGQRRPRRYRPQVENLEERCIPAAFTFSQAVLTTANPTTGPMAFASHPDTTAGALDEIEAGDDFVAPTAVRLTSATFTGLLPSNTPVANITDVVVEIYRVFPKDSDVTRTTGAPTFATTRVPTRVNSPSDVVFDSRDSAPAAPAAPDLTFNATILNAAFTATNSVVTGINAKPGQTTGGEGPQTGEEVQFNVTFTTPISLPADHYFFVPQVALTGNPTPGFLWLAGMRLNPTFTPDLQAWIRGPNIEPDWLRIGTDIVGGNPAPTFNGAFSLAGVQILPPTLTGLSVGSANEGSGNVPLTVSGSEFTTDSVVQWNGMALPTTFVSSTQLTTTIPASLLGRAGVFNISVGTLIPGQGLVSSNTLPFTVLESIPTVTATGSVSGSGNASVRGSFSDLALESHQAVVNWGDGFLTIEDLGVSRSGNFNLSHHYSRRQAHRTHTVTVRIIDDEGGTSRVLTFRLSPRHHGLVSPLS